MQIVVLGAGISGLTAAFELTQHGAGDCSLYDQNSTPGGLCRRIERHGFTFDIVSHVLHFRSEEARRLVHVILDGNLMKVERSACIYFRGRYVPYPFQTHLGFLPLAPRAYCIAAKMQAWAKNMFNGIGDPKNFEDWIHRHYGAGIAHHFMVPYNTKLWGLPPREMSTDWVGSFVPRGSLGQTISGALFRRSNSIGYNSSFYFPKRGSTQALVDALAARVRHMHMHKRVTGIDLDSKTIRFQDREIRRYDQLISTIPLKFLALHAKGMPEELRRAATELRSSSVLSVNYCIRRPLPHKHHWVYFHEPHFPFFRLVFPANICPSLAPPGCSIISAEISNPDLSRKHELEQKTTEHLFSLNLIERLSDILFVVSNYVEQAYPVHDLGREALVPRLLDFLKTRDVWSIGRFGGWRYSSIDDAIAEALQTIREVYSRGQVVQQVTPLPLG